MTSNKKPDKWEEMILDLLNSSAAIWMKEEKTPAARGVFTYQHNLSVSKMAYELSSVFCADSRICARAGFLHDCAMEEYSVSIFSKIYANIFHYIKAAEIAHNLGEPPAVIYAIKTHMFPLFALPPLNKEAFTVWLARC